MYRHKQGLKEVVQIKLKAGNNKTKGWNWRTKSSLLFVARSPNHRTSCDLTYIHKYVVHITQQKKFPFQSICSIGFATGARNNALCKKI